MASSYQDRINARRGTGVNKKKKKVKPVSKDPRPKQSDIGKKYKNYGEFRKAVKAWRVRNGFAKPEKPKEKRKYVSPRERKFGKDKLKINKEIDKQVDKYVADRKVPINRDLNKDNRKNVPNKENKKDNKVDNEEKVAPNQKLKIKSTTKGGPVKSGVEYARSKGDDLAGYRRGAGTKLGKDTRITKKLKKAGFTEDRLARLRKQHAEFKAKRKKKRQKK